MLGYGEQDNQLVITYKNIKLLPKRRYHIMANYLWGILSDVMMRETAGIQANFDYKSEDDAIKKLSLALKKRILKLSVSRNISLHRLSLDSGISYYTLNSFDTQV